MKFNVNSNDRIRQQPDGSLFIRDVTRTDAGEYSCKVENDFGQDSVTHQLIVNAPPRAPQVSIELQTLRDVLKEMEYIWQVLSMLQVHFNF